VRPAADGLALYQGLANRLIADTLVIDMTSRVQRRLRLGGLLNFYRRAA